MLSAGQKPVFYLANQQTAEPCGRAIVTVNIGDVSFNFKFYVMENLATPCIFGLDILGYTQCVTNYGTNVACFFDSMVTLSITNKRYYLTRAQLARGFIFPLRSETKLNLLLIAMAMEI